MPEGEGWAAASPHHLRDRAFLLARTGRHQTVESIRRQLICEGFTYVRFHLSDRRLCAELKTLCRTAGAAAWPP